MTDKILRKIVDSYFPGRLIRFIYEYLDAKVFSNYKPKKSDKTLKEDYKYL